MATHDESSTRLRKNSVHLFGLAVLAIAQPILDLLSRQTEFFVVRRSGPGEIVLLVVCLVVVLPLALLAVELGARAVSKRAYEAVHSLLITTLASLLFLQGLQRGLSLPGPLLIVVSVVLGSTCALALFKTNWVRVLFRYMGFLSLLLVVAFFFKPGVRSLMFPASVQPREVAATSATTPVVMVVFDAFPLTLLMNEEGLIDASLFPNLAQLRRESIWFRNATTVSDNTLHAVPSMLTGLLPEVGRQATTADHPNNLFSLLAGSHEMRVFETQTHLWDGDGKLEHGPRIGERVASLARDVSVVFLHLTLPSDLRESLPSISQSWEDFAREISVNAGGDDPAGGPVAVANLFLRGIEVTESPVLHFMHVLLPHPPYFRYPSGTRYTRSRVEPSGEGDQWGLWSDDEWAVMQSYQRLLLQTGFVDSFVGDLVSKLRDVDLYDDSLLVITADHGSSFRPGLPHRPITESNIGEIMPIPLLIKTPHQSELGVRDLNVQTVDILPTVAELLQIDIPWEIDGSSVLSRSEPRSAEKVCFMGARGPLEVEVAELEVARGDALQWKLDRFQSGASGVFGIGPHSQLVGRDTREMVVREGDTGIVTTLNEAEALRDVDLQSGFVPGSLSGYLQPAPGLVQLAVSLNGRIVATTRTFLAESLARIGAWATLVPEEVFIDGVNELEVFLIEEDAAGNPSLARVPLEAGAPSILGVNLCLSRLGSVKRSGFHSSKQTADGTSMAWTTGDARISMPIDPAQKPRVVEVAVRRSSPEGAWVKILANNVVVFDGEIQPGEWRASLSLESVPIKKRLKISIQSSRFVREGLRGDRSYGLALEGLWLH